MHRLIPTTAITSTSSSSRCQLGWATPYSMCSLRSAVPNPSVLMRHKRILEFMEFRVPVTCARARRVRADGRSFLVEVVVLASAAVRSRGGLLLGRPFLGREPRVQCSPSACSSSRSAGDRPDRRETLDVVGVRKLDPLPEPPRPCTAVSDCRCTFG